MRVRLAFLLVALVAQAAAVTRADHRFHSPALQREMPYRVLLPAGYETSSRRYPVLYLLHGLDGRYTDWTERTKLAQHLSGLDLIVVTPEGANSWYVNWHDGAAERWEDYLVVDLVAEIDARFRTDARREARFIAGLSMGGYGALRVALKHPRRYSFAASLSGAFNITRLESFGWRQSLRAEFARAFGPAGSERRAADDLFSLAQSATPDGLPSLYIDCGASDTFLAANRELVAILQQSRIPYEYRETQGAHTWAYWDRQVVPLLASLPLR